MVELPQPLSTLQSYCSIVGGSPEAQRRGASLHRNKIWVLPTAFTNNKQTNKKQKTQQNSSSGF
jgi:hypothetical protein